MLGTELSVVFNDLKPICWDIADLDITKEEIVQKRIREMSPSVIINASAYTNVDGAEENEELANQINGIAVGHLAKTAELIGAKLVHYSTDYIFNGENKAGYREDEKPDPINAYGRSKLLGEEIIRKECKKYYIIRTSWLYGRAGKNFVETMIDLASKNKELKVVNDQFGKPTYTLDLALETKKILEHGNPYGIYHITNEEQTSWYDFAKKIFEIEGLKNEAIPVTSEQFRRPAPRPHYSSLINTKLPRMRNWQNALADYLSKR